MSEATVVWGTLIGTALVCSALAHLVLRTFVVACGIGAVSSVVVFHVIMYYLHDGFGKMWEIGAIINLLVATVIAIVVGVLIRHLRPPKQGS